MFFCQCQLDLLEIGLVSRYAWSNFTRLLKHIKKTLLELSLK